LKHGRGGNADIARLDMVAQAAAARERRAIMSGTPHEGDTRVVEMDYNDYSGEPEPEAPEFLAEELDDILPADEWEPAPEPARVGVVASVDLGPVMEQLDGLATALVLIAEKIGPIEVAFVKETALHDAILARLDVVLSSLEEAAAVPPPPQVGIFWRAWRYLFAR
jgi:hypothetical protein